jgi:hypothetical protein
MEWVAIKEFKKGTLSIYEFKFYPNRCNQEGRISLKRTTQDVTKVYLI